VKSNTILFNLFYIMAHQGSSYCISLYIYNYITDILVIVKV